MRLRLLVASLIVLGFFGMNARQGEAQGQSRLEIIAQGATMGFMTLGLDPASFTLASGESQVWMLKPGTYVVVHAPPLDGGLEVSCSDGNPNQHRLKGGADVTCTFTATP